LQPLATKSNAQLKVRVTEANENDKMTVKQIMMKFNVGKTEVYNILKAKSKIKNLWLNCSKCSTEWKLRKTENESINKIVCEWFVSTSARSFQICRVLGDVKKVAEKLGKKEFKGTNIYLQSFRKRPNFFNEICGEAGCVCEAVADWAQIV
jgi:hypothetical protein